MKNSLLFAGMIFLTSGVAIAKTIDFTTPIKWNTAVVERALNDSGFIGTADALWDVRVTHEHILAELLKMESASIQDATRICMQECNKSDFLRNGRGASRKKCPDLCTNFASKLIDVNNQNVDKSVLTAGRYDESLDNLDGSPTGICRVLTKTAQTQGLSLPMLCGGKCSAFGDDDIIVTDNEQTVQYTVGDFCDGTDSGRDYYYVVSVDGMEDVSNLNDEDRLKRLKTAQTKPIRDYQANQEQQKNNAVIQGYATKVQNNGYCPEVEIGSATIRGAGDDLGPGVEKICKPAARRYAQQHACKLRNYGASGYYDNGRLSGDCYANSEWRGIYEDVPSLMERKWVGSYTAVRGHVIQYEYTPTYEECVATFNEATCR